MASVALDRSHREEVALDDVSRQRLLVAEATADTLESLVEARAWAQLDPALGAHLLGQSSRLRVFLTRVRATPEVRQNEPQFLALRRLERRLEVVEELLAPPPAPEGGAAPEGERSPSQVFLGDFSGKTLTDEQRQASRERRIARKRGQRTLAWSPSARRLALVAGAGLAVVVLSVVARFATPATTVRGAKPKPSLALEPNAHLEDLKTFLPVVSSVLVNGCLTVSVDPQWMDLPAARRERDAASAAVYLENRKIRKFVISLTNGTEVYRTDGQVTEAAQGPQGLEPLKNRIGAQFGPQGAVAPPGG